MFVADSIGVHLNHYSVDASGPVVGARVDAHGAADLVDASALVYVPEEAEGRLILLDDFAYRCASHGDLHGLAPDHDRLEGVIQFDRGVQAAPMWRNVDVEDRAAGTLELLGQLA